MSHEQVDMVDGVHEILVVDDQQQVRLRWKQVLEEASFRVRLASDGNEALSEIYRHAPDLVILDLNMPHMKGDEVCRRLKQSQQTESIPVIMVTASSDYANKIESLRYGANDYLIKDELKKTRNEELVQRVRNALRLRVDNRDGNPLSGLPGNARIERELNRRIFVQEPMAFLYIDIDNFKAFNDYYGYRQGDEAILQTSDLLKTTVREHGGPADFIGHIGGDDFVVMTTPDVAQAVAEAIISGFDEILQGLFDAEAYTTGQFSIEGRTGAMETFELMSLTIALITNESRPLHHPAQVNDRAMELKKYGKMQQGSFIARERRLAS